MKQPFRFHRGEFNGFFLLNLVTFLNYAIQDIKDELVYWANMQFKLASEVSGDELPIRDDDMIGISQIAGVFPIYFSAGVWPGMIFFSASEIVGGNQYSERGLYNTLNDEFDYVRTTPGPYSDDIVTEATSGDRMTLVPSGQAIVGYVRSDQELYNTDGTVNYANVYPSPPGSLPPNVVVEPFYGEDFLTMSSDADVEIPTSIESQKLLFEVMQTIRYNGPSISTFFELTEDLLGAYIYNITITWNTFRFIVTYYTDDSVIMPDRLNRYKIWLYVIELKFKLFELDVLE